MMVSRPTSRKGADTAGKCCGAARRSHSVGHHAARKSWCRLDAHRVRDYRAGRRPAALERDGSARRFAGRQSVSGTRQRRTHLVLSRRARCSAVSLGESDLDRRPRRTARLAAWRNSLGVRQCFARAVEGVDDVAAAAVLHASWAARRAWRSPGFRMSMVRSPFAVAWPTPMWAGTVSAGRSRTLRMLGWRMLLSNWGRPPANSPKRSSDATRSPNATGRFLARTRCARGRRKTLAFKSAASPRISATRCRVSFPISWAVSRSRRQKAAVAASWQAGLRIRPIRLPHA